MLTQSELRIWVADNRSSQSACDGRPQVNSPSNDHLLLPHCPCRPSSGTASAALAASSQVCTVQWGAPNTGGAAGPGSCQPWQGGGFAEGQAQLEPCPSEAPQSLPAVPSLPASACASAKLSMQCSACPHPDAGLQDACGAEYAVLRPDKIAGVADDLPVSCNC